MEAVHFNISVCASVITAVFIQNLFHLTIYSALLLCLFYVLELCEFHLEWQSSSFRQS